MASACLKKAEVKESVCLPTAEDIKAEVETSDTIDPSSTSASAPKHADALALAAEGSDEEDYSELMSLFVAPNGGDQGPDGDKGQEEEEDEGDGADDPDEGGDQDSETEEEESEEEESFQIHLHMPDSKVLTLTVQPSNTIGNVKGMIMNKEGIPIKLQRLVFAEHEMEDNNTISRYNLVEASVIYVLLRIKGSGKRARTSTSTASKSSIVTMPTDTELGVLHALVPAVQNIVSGYRMFSIVEYVKGASDDWVANAADICQAKHIHNPQRLQDVVKSVAEITTLVKSLKTIQDCIDAFVSRVEGKMDFDELKKTAEEELAVRKDRWRRAGPSTGSAASVAPLMEVDGMPVGF